jgi:uncharacterized protein (TIGR00369 family)
MALSDELVDLVAASPFHAWAGISVLEVSEGEVTLALEAEPHHRNLLGTIHGGMVATLADTAAGLAVRSMLEPGRGHVTVSLGVEYLRAAAPGRLIGRGRALRVGTKIAHAAADVTDEQGVLLATATAAIALTDL